MDIPEAYIKMCEKADGIQKLHKQMDGYYYNGEDVVSFGEYVSVNRIGENTVSLINVRYSWGCAESYWEDTFKILVWLPRQDQLQEILLNTETGKYGDPTNLLTLFHDWLIKSNVEFDNKTLEMLWLEYVMKEKFRKGWDGKDWIKYDEQPG